MYLHSTYVSHPEQEFCTTTVVQSKYATEQCSISTHNTDFNLIFWYVYFLGWNLPNPSCCVQWQPREDAPFTEQQCQCQCYQKCTHFQFTIIITLVLIIWHRSRFFSDSQCSCSLILVMNDSFNIFSHSRMVRLHCMWPASNKISRWYRCW